MTCHQTKRGEGGKLEREGRHRHSWTVGATPKVETKRRPLVEKGVRTACCGRQRATAPRGRACQDGAGGDSRRHKVTPRCHAESQTGISAWWLSASSASLVDTRISGRSFKHLPRPYPSCEGWDRGCDWAECKADKAIALVGCSAP